MQLVESGEIMKKIYLNLIVFFVANAVLAQDNTWFNDVTDEVGLRNCRGSRVFSVDVNGDNFPDLLYTGKDAIRNTMELYLNLEDEANPGKRKFVRYTEESGINAPVYGDRKVRWSDVVGLADFDNDGDVDMMTCTYTHRISYFTTIENGVEQGHYSEVLLNDGKGHFTILENSGMHDIVAYDGKISLVLGKDHTKYDFDYPPYFLNATGISFLDYDYDGNIDAYISTWFTNYLSTKIDYMYALKMNDILLKGNGDGTFTQVFDPAIKKIKQPMYGVNVTDYNNDGWQDIITSAYCRSGGSIFKNKGDGTFADATAETGYTSQLMGGDHGQNLCQWEALPGDFDNDGDMDLIQVLVHGGFDEDEGHTHISINNGEYANYSYEWDLDLLERDIPKSTTHGGDMGATWVDFNGDMRLDAIICQDGYESGSTNTSGQTRAYFNMQLEDGTFKEVTDDLGLLEAANRPHSVEPGDFDLDGDNDLFISRSFDLGEGDGRKCYQTLWENNVNQGYYWTSMKITPPENCNRSAIGTRITCYTNGVAQIREIQSGLGHFGNTQPFIKNFGLEHNPAIDSLKIRFPNKELQEKTLYHPPVNVILDIDAEKLNGFIFPDNEAHGVIAFSESKVDFGLVKFGETAQKTFYVENLGNADLLIDAISLLYNDSEVYRIISSPELPIKLAPNEKTEITIEYTPNERTDFNSYLVCSNDAFNSDAGMILLTGNCMKDEAMIMADANEINFGVVLNEDVIEKKIKITNFGELDLGITDVSFDADYLEYFSVEEGEKQITLKSGESTEYTVRFTPNVEQDINITTNMVIFSNAYNFSEFEIPVIARGETRKARIAIDEEYQVIEFPDAEVGCRCEEPLIVKSEGTKPLEITEMEVRLDKKGIFTIKDDNPPYIIEPGNSHEFTVVFSPKKEGVFGKQLWIHSNNYDKAKTSISFKGSGYIAESVNDELGINLGIYPNPIENRAVLEFEIENTLNEKMEIKVLDYLGRERMDIPAPNMIAGVYSQEIDFSSLPNGMYILRIISAGKTSDIKIVINR